MMISMISTLDDRIAVLVRLYPVDRQTNLPPGLQLTVQDEHGVNLLADSNGDPYIAIAREEIKDSCIQLYFVADSADLFVPCVTLDHIKETKIFQL